MRMRRNEIIFLSAAAVVSLSNGFVVLFRSSIVGRHHLSNHVRLQSSTIRRSLRPIVVIASANDNEDKEEDDVITTEENENAPTFNKDVSERSNINEGPSTLSRVTFRIFQLFSYCLQAAGAFFFIGLLLNFAGFGYTVDMEHGLVVDKIKNIRNTVQFEMEIKREEKEDVMKAGRSSSGAVGSTQMLDSSFKTTPSNDVNNL